MNTFVYKSFEECCCDYNVITLTINLMYTIVYKVTEEVKIKSKLYNESRLASIPELVTLNKHIKCKEHSSHELFLNTM